MSKDGTSYYESYNVFHKSTIGRKLKKLRDITIALNMPFWTYATTCTCIKYHSSFSLFGKPLEKMDDLQTIVSTFLCGRISP